jgi:hypothetical protein
MSVHPESAAENEMLIFWHEGKLNDNDFVIAGGSYPNLRVGKAYLVQLHDKVRFIGSESLLCHPSLLSVPKMKEKDATMPSCGEPLGWPKAAGTTRKSMRRSARNLSRLWTVCRDSIILAIDCINRAHPLFIRESRKAATYTMYIARFRRPALFRRPFDAKMISWISKRF